MKKKIIKIISIILVISFSLEQIGYAAEYSALRPAATGALADNSISRGGFEGKNDASPKSATPGKNRGASTKEAVFELPTFTMAELEIIYPIMEEKARKIKEEHAAKRNKISFPDLTKRKATHAATGYGCVVSLADVKYIYTSDLAGCVCLSLYDKEGKVGALLHITSVTNWKSAIDIAVEKFAIYGSAPQNLEAKIIGGETDDIYSKIIITAILKFLNGLNIKVAEKDILYSSPRNIALKLQTGELLDIDTEVRPEEIPEEVLPNIRSFTLYKLLVSVSGIGVISVAAVLLLQAGIPVYFVVGGIIAAGISAGMLYKVFSKTGKSEPGIIEVSVDKDAAERENLIKKLKQQVESTRTLFEEAKALGLLTNEQVRSIGSRIDFLSRIVKPTASLKGLNETKYILEKISNRLKALLEKPEEKKAQERLERKKAKEQGILKRIESFREKMLRLKEADTVLGRTKTTPTGPVRQRPPTSLAITRRDIPDGLYLLKQYMEPEDFATIFSLLGLRREDLSGLDVKEILAIAREASRPLLKGPYLRDQTPINTLMNAIVSARRRIEERNKGCVAEALTDLPWQRHKTKPITIASAEKWRRPNPSGKPYAWATMRDELMALEFLGFLKRAPKGKIKYRYFLTPKFLLIQTKEMLTEIINVKDDEGNLLLQYAGYDEKRLAIAKEKIDEILSPYASGYPPDYALICVPDLVKDFIKEKLQKENITQINEIEYLGSSGYPYPLNIPPEELAQDEKGDFRYEKWMGKYSTKDELASWLSDYYKKPKSFYMKMLKGSFEERKSNTLWGEFHNAFIIKNVRDIVLREPQQTYEVVAKSHAGEKKLFYIDITPEELAEFYLRQMKVGEYASFTGLCWHFNIKRAVLSEIIKNLEKEGVYFINKSIDVGDELVRVELKQLELFLQQSEPQPEIPPETGLGLKYKKYEKYVYRDEPICRYYFKLLCELNLELIGLRVKRKMLTDPAELSKTAGQLDAIAGQLEAISEKIPQPEYLITDFGKRNLRQEAIDQLSNARQLIKDRNEPAANACISAAIKRFCNEIVMLLNRRRSRLEDKKRFWFDEASKTYKLIQGQRLNWRISESAETSVCVPFEKEFQTSWEAFRSVDEQTDSQLAEQKLLMDYINILEQMQAGIKNAVPEKLQSWREALTDMFERLEKAIVDEKEISAYGLRVMYEQLYLMQLYPEEEKTRNAAATIITVIKTLLNARLDSLTIMINRTQKGRLKSLRKQIKSRNNEIIGRAQNIITDLENGDFEKALGKTWGFIDIKNKNRRLQSYFREPEFAALPGLLWTLKSQIENADKTAALKTVDIIKKKGVTANYLSEFMRIYRAIYVEENIGAKHTLGKQQAYTQAFQNYVGKTILPKGTTRHALNRLWHTKCSQAAFIPLNINNPQKKSERIINPAFLAVYMFILIQEVNDLEKYLKYLKAPNRVYERLLANDYDDAYKKKLSNAYGLIERLIEKKKNFTDLSKQDIADLTAALYKDYNTMPGGVDKVTLYAACLEQMDVFGLIEQPQPSSSARELAAAMREKQSEPLGIRIPGVTPQPISRFGYEITFAQAA